MKYGKCAEIKGDLYDISRRIKEIDKDYFIVYSYVSRRFEVHHRAQRGGSFCLAVPYGALDTRTLDLTRRTRAERKEKLLEEIERDNARLQRDEIYSATKRAAHRFEEAVR